MRQSLSYIFINLPVAGVRKITFDYELKFDNTIKYEKLSLFEEDL